MVQPYNFRSFIQLRSAVRRLLITLALHVIAMPDMPLLLLLATSLVPASPSAAAVLAATSLSGANKSEHADKARGANTTTSCAASAEMTAPNRDDHRRVRPNPLEGEEEEDV